MEEYHPPNQNRTVETIPEFDPKESELIFFEKYQPTGLTEFKGEYLPPKNISITAKFKL